jgi:MarR family
VGRIRRVERGKLCIVSTYSAEQVAGLLGTSRARVTRAARACGIGAAECSRLRFDDGDVRALADHLGVTAVVDGLSRTESVVLAELSRRPLGLISSRAVARACGISPAAAVKAVQSLVSQGLVTETRATVALGKAREVTVLRANVRHPRWTALLEQLRRVRPPVSAEAAPAGLPRHLEHAFWNVDHQTFRRLKLTDDGPFIASRALATSDPALLAFAARHLDAGAWRAAANLRGLAPQTRQLAVNLALAAKDER